MLEWKVKWKSRMGSRMNGKMVEWFVMKILLSTTQIIYLNRLHNIEIHIIINYIIINNSETFCTRLCIQNTYLYKKN